MRYHLSFTSSIKYYQSDLIGNFTFIKTLHVAKLPPLQTYNTLGSGVYNVPDPLFLLEPDSERADPHSVLTAYSNPPSVLRRLLFSSIDPCPTTPLWIPPCPSPDSLTLGSELRLSPFL